MSKAERQRAAAHLEEYAESIRNGAAMYEHGRWIWPGADGEEDKAIYQDSIDLARKLRNP